MKRKYKVIHSGWVAGVQRKKGDVVELTEAQARYEYVELIVTPKTDKSSSENSKGKNSK